MYFEECCDLFLETDEIAREMAESGDTAAYWEATEEELIAEAIRELDDQRATMEREAVRANCPIHGDYDPESWYGCSTCRCNMNCTCDLWEWDR